MEKNFNEWNFLKQNLDKKEKTIFFKERDIWWCSLGLNIGHEENGKNTYFTRPILVIIF
jgi:mRNA interferase MazF